MCAESRGRADEVGRQIIIRAVSVGAFDSGPITALEGLVEWSDRLVCLSGRIRTERGGWMDLTYPVLLQSRDDAVRSGHEEGLLEPFSNN